MRQPTAATWPESGRHRFPEPAANRFAQQQWWRTPGEQGQGQNWPQSRSPRGKQAAGVGRHDQASAPASRASGRTQRWPCPAWLRSRRPDDQQGITKVDCADQQPAESAGWPQPGCRNAHRGEVAAKRTPPCLQKTSTCTGPLRKPWPSSLTADAPPPATRVCCLSARAIFSV